MGEEEYARRQKEEEQLAKKEEEEYARRQQENELLAKKEEEEYARRQKEEEQLAKKEEEFSRPSLRGSGREEPCRDYTDFMKKLTALMNEFGMEDLVSRI